MSVRAKFKVYEITQRLGGTGQTVVLQPMYDTSIEEDRRYSTYTPSGRLEMYVDNPNVHFELGEDYYLDFTKVEQPVSAPA